MTRDRAFQVIAELGPLASQKGFLLGLYGSLLYVEEGKDLDLLAEPKREQARPDDLITALHLRGWTLEDRYSGILADSAILSRGEDLLDIRFGRTVMQEIPR